MFSVWFRHQGETYLYGQPYPTEKQAMEERYKASNPQLIWSSEIVVPTRAAWIEGPRLSPLCGPLQADQSVDHWSHVS